jgi:hypothetical protein
MIATSSVHLWKIDLWFLVRFFHGFALGFAALAQRTQTTAIMDQILSKEISSHVKAMTDVLNKCRPLSNIFLPNGHTAAPGFCMQDCTFCTRPQIHLLLPYAFQKSETVVEAPGTKTAPFCTSSYSLFTCSRGILHFPSFFFMPGVMFCT